MRARDPQDGPHRVVTGANDAPQIPNTNEAKTKVLITRARKRRGEATIVLDDHGQHIVDVVGP